MYVIIAELELIRLALKKHLEPPISFSCSIYLRGKENNRLWMGCCWEEIQTPWLWWTEGQQPEQSSEGGSSMLWLSIFQTPRVAPSAELPASPALNPAHPAMQRGAPWCPMAEGKHGAGADATSLHQREKCTDLKEAPHNWITVSVPLIDANPECTMGN